MAFEPKKEQIKKALGEKIAERRVPTASLPKREEPEGFFLCLDLRYNLFLV